MRLPTNLQIDRVFASLKKHGIDAAKCRVDISQNGIAVYPPNDSGESNPYDLWKKQDNERPTHS